MPDTALAADNLFQLNVLVWASFPQPPGAPVTPVLRNAGYILWSVEQPLVAGVAELARLRTSSQQIGPNPVADVVFHRDVGGTYVLVECKPSSFGVSSDRAPQARGMIVAGGNIASQLGLGGAPAGEVCYLVPADAAQAMDATLVLLASGVEGERFTACPTGSIGLSIKPAGVYLGLSNAPQGAAQMPRTLVPEQKVVAVRQDQDPRPLYVIPWIPDAQDDADLGAFKEKLRAQLQVWLGKVPIGSQVTLSFEDLLDVLTRGVFRYWRDRESLTGGVFRKLGQVVELLFGDDRRVLVRRWEVRVNLNVERDREELMERVRTAGVPEKLPEGVQLRMDELS